MRRTTLVAILLLAGALTGLARADEFDPKKFRSLESLAHKVERDGFKHFTFAAFEPGLPRESLVFEPAGNDVAKEKALRRAWIAEYLAISNEAATKAKAAKNDKKHPQAKADGGHLLAAVAPRWHEMRVFQGFKKAVFDKDEAERFDERAKATARFLKRYDFGPKIAQATADGTAAINVRLAPDTFKVVERAIDSWKYEPLKDEKGSPVKLGAKSVEYATEITQGDVREALAMLEGEVFVVRYSKLEDEKETDLIRVTGAKLLFATYYFIEHGERLIVARR